MRARVAARWPGLKYDVPPVAVRPARRCGQRPRQAPLVEGNARDHRDLMLPAVGEQRVFRRLVEKVVDHLHAVDESSLQRPQHVARFPAIDTDAERPHQLFALERLDRALPSTIRRPRVAPDVKLLQIDRVHAQVGEALLGVFANMIGGVGLVDVVFGASWPLQIFRRDLRRDEKGTFLPARVVPDCLAEQPFAFTSAVRPAPCRRNYTRARAHDRASSATRRRRTLSTRPCPRGHSRLLRLASPFGRMSDNASNLKSEI